MHFSNHIFSPLSRVHYLFFRPGSLALTFELHMTDELVGRFYSTTSNKVATFVQWTIIYSTAVPSHLISLIASSFHFSFSLSTFGPFPFSTRSFSSRLLWTVGIWPSSIASTIIGLQLLPSAILDISLAISSLLGLTSSTPKSFATSKDACVLREIPVRPLKSSQAIS